MFRTFLCNMNIEYPSEIRFLSSFFPRLRECDFPNITQPKMKAAAHESRKISFVHDKHPIALPVLYFY